MKQKITNDHVREAYEILQKYKAGKAVTEQRIIENEQWWRMKNYSDGTVNSGWLFNAIINKHADAMEALPEVFCLPREEGDSESAELMSAILPAIFEENKFDMTYSECWYDKLKSGTACYGVFWNPILDNGSGNIDIRRVDILNLFWEPGICDIQYSKNLFHVELCDNEILRGKYPVLEDCLSSPVFDTSKYVYDETFDTADKSAVVDWYYKKHNGEREVVHFCKFCNGILLYASENDDDYSERGFYDHGKYPFFMDKMYPSHGSPCGLGLIDMMKGTANQIDILSTSIMNNAKMAAQRRFFVRQDGALNEEEFADWKKPFVHYAGSGDPNSSILPIEIPNLSGIYVSILNNKIDELKETSGNRDFSQGSTSKGVTAASAIAALQEAGTKTSRDVIFTSYKTFEDISAMVIRLIHQFYTLPRCFRILGKNGENIFKYCSSDNVSCISGEPVFDIKVSADKKSAFSQASMNELACNMYKMGMFAPENAGDAEICLSMMDFEGRDEIAEKVRKNRALTEWRND